MTPQQIADALADSVRLAKLNGIRCVQRGESLVFNRRLEYNARANSWLDLKTGECGLVKTGIADLLPKFFPQPQKGGAK
jgi:hypothetical protein